MGEEQEIHHENEVPDEVQGRGPSGEGNRAPGENAVQENEAHAARVDGQTPEHTRQNGGQCKKGLGQCEKGLVMDLHVPSQSSCLCAATAFVVRIVLLHALCVPCWLPQKTK